MAEVETRREKDEQGSFASFADDEVEGLEREVRLRPSERLSTVPCREGITQLVKERREGRNEPASTLDFSFAESPTELAGGLSEGFGPVREALLAR
jgi:hypothetical protein